MNPDHELLHFPLSDSSDKRGAVQPLVQMSLGWVEDRSTNEGLPAVAAVALRRAKNRRVLLVTFESEGALDHAQALADIHLGKADPDVHPHVDHGITREWEAGAIDAVVYARGEAYRQRTTTGGTTPGDEAAAKPSKPSKPKK